MATTTGGTTDSKAEQAGDSTSLEWLARGGLIAYGVVHLLVGWLALQIAWGTSGGTSADTSGALKTLADQPFGKVLLWVVAVGLVALALWQVSEAIWGHPDRDRAKRVRKQVTSGAKAAVYAALAVSAALVRPRRGLVELPIPGTGHHRRPRRGPADGCSSSPQAWPSSASASPASSKASGNPSPRRSTPRRCPPRPARACCGWAGRIPRQGRSPQRRGGLLTYATLTFDRQTAQGLDGALQTILAQPFGRFLLTAVALGFAAFGLFAILQSRYRPM